MRRLFWESMFGLLAAACGVAGAQTVQPSPGGAQLSLDDSTPCAPETGAGERAGNGFSWMKVPPLQLPLPRTGFFVLPPNWPGYYSLRDLLTGTWREQPPPYGYPPFSSNPYPYFEANFRYLDDPGNTETDWLDPFKRIHLGDNWLLSLGGEERLRFMNEIDDARLTNVENPHLLSRTRVYGDLWFRDIFRVYVEGIDAETSPQRLPPLSIDVDHLDIWNLFIDLKVWDFDGKPVYVRVGRQNLYFGSQRLVAPSDWSNIPRTFQGVRTMYQGEQWSVDGFWVQPVTINPASPDTPNRQENFAGLWTTYRPRQGQSVDLYYLLLSQQEAVAAGQRGVMGGYAVSTLGSRYSGDYHNFLWDCEGMYQLGSWSNQSIQAGAFTTGVGYRLADLPMNPNLWAYLDYASGDPHPGQGDVHATFNQLVPWGHLYFGYLDLVGRQNILDPNLQATLNPANWIVLGMQCHFFYLASARDALYNASGQAIHIDPTGQSGTHVGDEIDLFAGFHLSMHQDVLIGYSHLFTGQFLQKADVSPQPNLFYVQYNFRW